VGEKQSIKELAVSTAHRLRLLQSELCDESSEVRAKSLADSIRDALGRVVPEQRRDFLELMDSHFPTFQDGGTAPAKPAIEPAIAETLDPATLTERLAGAAASLPAAQKQAIVDRLKKAGFPIGAPAASPDGSLQELHKILQLAATERVDPARAAELAVILAGFVAKLDQAVWASWAQISPAGNIRRPGALQKTMARFVRGETPAPGIAQDSETLLKLTASLIVSLQRIGPTLFHQYFDSIEPATISADVEGSFLKAKDVRCWQKYTERAAQMDGESFSAAMFVIIARFVHDFFYPGGAPAKAAASG
jgi:hypothetical protein